MREKWLVRRKGWEGVFGLRVDRSRHGVKIGGSRRFAAEMREAARAMGLDPGAAEEKTEGHRVTLEWKGQYLAGGAEPGRLVDEGWRLEAVRTFRRLMQ